MASASTRAKKIRNKRYEALVNAAHELNELLGLEPPIDTSNTTQDKLEGMLLEAAELLEPDDRISDETAEIIESLGGVVPSRTKGADETEDEAEEEDPDEAREDNNDEEPEEPKPSEAEGKTQAEKPAEKVPRRRRYSRTMALADALRSTKGKPFTTARIVELSRMLYEKENNVRDDSDRGARVSWDVSYALLVNLGILTKTPDGWVFNLPEAK